MKINEIALQQVLRTYGSSLRLPGWREKSGQNAAGRENREVEVLKNMETHDINYDVKARIQREADGSSRIIDFLD